MAIGKGRYGKWRYRSDSNCGDEEMGRDQMVEVEQFEHMSKDELGDHSHTRC